jgi:predicted ATPase
MLEQLIVRNFKCLDDVRLPLAPLSVLAGLNGMGKSTAIQTLLLLHQSHQVSTDGNVRRLVLNGPLVNIGTAGDALWEGAEQELLALGFLAEGQELVWEFAYQEGDDELRGLDSNPIAVPQHQGIFTDAFHYLRAERFGPRASSPVSSTAVQYRRQIGYDGEYAPFFLATFGTEEIPNERLHHPAAPSTQIRHELETWLGEISPGMRIYTEAHKKLDLVSLAFAVSSPLGETQHFRATNVGFGVSYIMPIILAVLAATPGTLILLENPEAHLHPQGQAKMGELLALAAQGRVQIIVETHSDHLLNGIRLAVHGGRASPDTIGLLFFSREQKADTISTRIKMPRMDEAGRIDDWPEGFFDETEKALRQLLLPRQPP